MLSTVVLIMRSASIVVAILWLLMVAGRAAIATMVSRAMAGRSVVVRTVVGMTYHLWGVPIAIVVRLTRTSMAVASVTFVTIACEESVKQVA